MKKVAVLAANGKSGSLITKEALKQGYDVTAFVRKGVNADAKTIIKDIFELESADLYGFDYIIDAFAQWQDLDLHLKHIQHLAKILKDSKAKLIVVGGTGSLYMDKEHKIKLMDTADFPKEYLGVARATAEVLDFLREQKDFKWLYISPAAMFDYEGELKEYEMIGEEFKVNSKGESKISYKTYAKALIDNAFKDELAFKRISFIEK